MSKFLTKEILEPSIRRVEGDNGLTIKEIKFSKPDLAGAHFATGVETAQVTVESKEKGEREIDIFIKRPAESEAYKAFNSGVTIFEKEAQAYNQLLPEIINFSKSKGVKLEECVPLCYEAFGSGENTSIILEDLSIQGYKMFPYVSTDLQDVNHVTLALQAIAKLHAVSYVMKKSVNFPEKFSCLQEIFFKDSPDSILNMFHPSFQLSFPLFEEKSKVRENLEKFYERGFDHVINLVAHPNEKFVVVNHGDFWSNNMMFNYGESGKPISIKLADWQVTRYNTLAMDLVYFFFSSTTHEFRQHHLKDMLKLYYNEFTENMKKLGNEIPFTYDELYEEYMSMRLLGFIMIPAFVGLGLQTKDDHFADPDDIVGKDMMEGFAETAQKQMMDPKIMETMKRLISLAHDEVEDLLNEL